MAEQPVVTLYYHPFSIYSIIVRFAFALGETLNPEVAPKVHLEMIDLPKQGNLSEEYLSINSKGQVPALTSESLPETLTDSRDITKWLCYLEPALVPAEHKETIDRLLNLLYTFHAKALTVPPEDRRHGVPNFAAAMLETNDISEAYRRRLEIKSVFHDSTHSRTLEIENIELVEQQAREFVSELSTVIQEHQNGGKYIFGEKPTILDAHSTALAARLMDAGRDYIFPDSIVKDYAIGVIATDEWQRVTHGGRTIWNESLGPVAGAKA